MPRLRQHWLDSLADLLGEYIDREIEVMVDALKEGGRSPFSAEINEDQKREFYRRALFNRDGSPNDAGRKATIARIGIDGYVAVMQELAEHGDTSLPDVRGRAV